MNTKKKMFLKNKNQVSFTGRLAWKELLSTSGQRKTVLDENRKIAGKMKSDWKSVNRYVNKYA